MLMAASRSQIFEVRSSEHLLADPRQKNSLIPIYLRVVHNSRRVIAQLGRLGNGLNRDSLDYLMQILLDSHLPVPICLRGVACR